jgi:hypothetical protein
MGINQNCSNSGVRGLHKYTKVDRFPLTFSCFESDELDYQLLTFCFV